MSRSRSAVFTWCALVVSACGARTGLRDEARAVEEPPPATTAYCAKARYPAGAQETGFVLLLDRSESMKDDNKWNLVTTALSVFSKTPSVGKLPVALSLFPRSGAGCAVDAYVLPDVKMKRLDENPGFLEKLSATMPNGGTPTEPSLAGAITYARGLVLADPGRSVSVVLITDGTPTQCSTVPGTASVAHDGAENLPRILTYVVGMAGASFSSLDTLAAAGGTGKAIILGKGEAVAKDLVDTLLAVNQKAGSCTYALPQPAGITGVSATEVRVALAQGDAKSPLPRVAPSLCPSSSGFALDREIDPTTLTLCGATCSALAGAGTIDVAVTVGCGGDEDAPPSLPPDGMCASTVDFVCVPTCGDPNSTWPSCVSGAWTCPEGTVSTSACTTCPVTPHGCCGPTGELVPATCFSGAWTCPPGMASFGEPGCKPPAQCSPTLLCPDDEVCVFPDSLCESTARVGTCVPAPTSCPSTGPAVCACNKKTYANACAALADGQDVAVDKACVGPSGTFSCGSVYCKKGLEVCEITQHPFADPPVFPTYACVPSGGCCTDDGCPIGCGCAACASCTACGKACVPGDGPTVTCSLP